MTDGRRPSVSVASVERKRAALFCQLTEEKYERNMDAKFHGKVERNSNKTDNNLMSVSLVISCLSK